MKALFFLLLLMGCQSTQKEENLQAEKIRGPFWDAEVWVQKKESEKTTFDLKIDLQRDGVVNWRCSESDLTWDLDRDGEMDQTFDPTSAEWTAACGVDW